jgi:pimeloyl-ACP methyl ester carboxylesterase
MGLLKARFKHISLSPNGSCRSVQLTHHSTELAFGKPVNGQPLGRSQSLSTLKGTSMPYASNQGVRIYYEVEGDGPPLVLQHGSASSGAEWREMGYCDVLRRDYQLILIDARGHGASEKPHAPAAYALPRRVADVTAVLDALTIRHAHYFGYSMGGWIGFGLAKYAPERIRTLILGGAHPYAEPLQTRHTIMNQGLDVFIAASERFLGCHMTPTRRARLMATDLRALRAQTDDRPSIADVLPTMAMPCLLFVGETEPRLPAVQMCVQHLPNVTFFVVPGCDHFGAWARSDLVLPHVTTFLAQYKHTHIPQTASE